LKQKNLNAMENETQEVFNIISNNFGLQKADVLTIDDVKLILSARIRELLDKDVEKLLQIIYRIDISQKKIDGIFENSSKDEIAMQIALAVIERQLLKVQTRNLYKTGGDKIE